MSDIRTQLVAYLNSNELPLHDDLLSIIDNCISVLECEDSFYRPHFLYNGKNIPGGLLDYTSSKQIQLPLIVVPDLHARGDFIINLLDFTIPSHISNSSDEVTVLEALTAGAIRIVCVGDALHSELRGINRWAAAWEAYRNGNITSMAMKQEMCDGLSLLLMLMVLKISFPSHFHFLKGNHENVLNSNTDGDQSFVKFADEGNMVRDFLHEWYGDAVVHVLHCWEQSLPICAVFPNCAVSHSEPRRAFNRNDIIEYRLHPDVIFGMTWTGNDQAEQNSVRETLVSLLGKKQAEPLIWFGGHRPINTLYELRQNGTYIQIHNPAEENVAFVPSFRTFNPQTDIMSVERR